MISSPMFSRMSEKTWVCQPVTWKMANGRKSNERLRYSGMVIGRRSYASLQSRDCTIEGGNSEAHSGDPGTYVYRPRLQAMRRLGQTERNNPMTTQTKKRSGISSKRAFDLQSMIENRLKSIISAAIDFKSTNETITENICKDIFESEEWKRLPEYRRAYVRGYYAALREEIYRHHIVWMLSCDGNLMLSKEVDALTKAEGFDRNKPTPWSRIDSNLSRHVWKDANGLPLKDKSFDARFR